MTLLCSPLCLFGAPLELARAGEAQAQQKPAVNSDAEDDERAAPEPPNPRLLSRRYSTVARKNRRQRGEDDVDEAQRSPKRSDCATACARSPRAPLARDPPSASEPGTHGHAHEKVAPE
jgi:hypothetical protein